LFTIAKAAIKLMLFILR